MTNVYSVIEVGEDGDIESIFTTVHPRLASDRFEDIAAELHMTETLDEEFDGEMIRFAGDDVWSVAMFYTTLED